MSRARCRSLLDELDARRYAHTVEVVSVGPTFGPGEARIQPAQMGVAVLSTEGGASSAGPGTVLLGDGSATYSIALPLEAADMTVSELEILVGPDPSMVLGDQGQVARDVAGRLHARSARPDEWRPGTSSATSAAKRRSRSMIRARQSAQGGRIEVRVTGVEQDPNFGQMSVFVSARAAGVIGE